MEELKLIRPSMGHKRQYEEMMEEWEGFGGKKIVCLTGEMAPAEEMGDGMNLLFICSQNKRRSLTAEKIFDGYHGHRAFSAGTESNARIKVTPGLLKRADIIFYMEKKHVRRLREKYPDIAGDKEMICLNISDDYGYMDRELQEILKDCVYEYIS